MTFNHARLFGKTLFRFSAPGPHFLNEITNRQIYLSKPSEFNDPFDCQLEYERILRHDLASLIDENNFDVSAVIEKIGETVKRARLCCFSRARKNQLMWAHYAAKHTGICIGFDTNTLALASKLPLRAINYMSKHPLNPSNSVNGIHDEFELRTGVGLENTQASFFQAVALRLLCSKYSYWRYEREVRLISLNAETVSLPPKAITSVTIGLKATPTVKKSVYDALVGDEWQHVKLLVAEKVPEAYSLQFREINRDYLLR